jgi:hypothetical protein
MSNPWLKKNPFMSMWLSAANRVAASVRGQTTALAKRQTTAAVAQATQQNLALWQEALSPRRAKAKAKRKR